MPLDTVHIHGKQCSGKAGHGQVGPGSSSRQSAAVIVVRLSSEL